MKQIILLSLFFSQLFAISPNWYINQSIQSKSYELIGYGEGSILSEAKQLAKTDIAKMISTNISSSMSIDRYSDNKKYNKKISSNINEKSNVILNGLEIIQNEYKDNKYFIAIKYINLPLAKRIKLKFKDTSIIKESNNTYLNKTLLLNELKEEFGFYPKIKLYQNNVIINNQSFYLTNDNIIKLFTNIENKNIKIDMKDTFKDGEYYSVSAESKRSGYLNIFQVYESGETIVLFSNKKIKQQQNIIYPNPKDFDGIEAIVPNRQFKTKDLIVTALCSNKKDYSFIEKLDTTIQIKHQYFGELLNLIDSCYISTKILITKKR